MITQSEILEAIKKLPSTKQIAIIEATLNLIRDEVEQTEVSRSKMKHKLEEAAGDNGLPKLSAVDAFQVRYVSQTRFVQQLGKVSESKMQEITKSLAIVLSIEV